MGDLPEGVTPELAAFMDTMQPYIVAEHNREWEGKLPPPKPWREAATTPESTAKLKLLCEAFGAGLDAALAARANTQGDTRS